MCVCTVGVIGGAAAVAAHQKTDNQPFFQGTRRAKKARKSRGDVEIHEASVMYAVYNTLVLEGAAWGMGRA